MKKFDRNCDFSYWELWHENWREATSWEYKKYVIGSSLILLRFRYFDDFSCRLWRLELNISVQFINGFHYKLLREAPLGRVHQGGAFCARPSTALHEISESKRILAHGRNKPKTGAKRRKFLGNRARKSKKRRENAKNINREKPQHHHNIIQYTKTLC